MNFGEELCGEWLRHIRGCEFIQYNLRTTKKQGEIDVIGLNLVEKVVYICEVAVHLQGLQYVREGRTDNVRKLVEKFEKDIQWANDNFPKETYSRVFMLWSPIVKDRPDSESNNQMGHVQEVIETARTSWKVDIVPMVNASFLKAIDDLRDFAGRQTKELDSPVMRLLQVESHLRKHLSKGAKAVG